MSAFDQHHPAPLHSSSADRHRILELLTEVGPLDVESLRLRATFASEMRFKAACRDLVRQGAVDMESAGRGYRAHGDARPFNFDGSLNTRQKREEKIRRDARRAVAS